MVCVASRHGTLAAHKNFGCRCPTAIAADYRYTRDYYARIAAAGGPLLTPATGTHRRIQALSAAGWPAWVFHAALGRTQAGTIGPGQLLRSTRVTPRMAATIAGLYDRLEHEPGPSARAATAARKQGWAPPWAWGPDNPIDNPESRPSLDPPGRDRVGEYWAARVVLGMSHGRALRDAGLSARELHGRQATDAV